MIYRIATNTSNSYHFSESFYVLRQIIFITVFAQNVLLQHERKRCTLPWLLDSTFNNARPRASQPLLMRHFSLSMYDLKLNMITVKYVTDFRCFCGLSDLLSWCMRSPVWIHCCEWPNWDFCISQGSVATVLKCGRLNYSHLCQVFSWCCMPKIIIINQCCTNLFKK